MNTLEAIESRRSIRRFKDKPVARELVERMLDATVKAPSGKNRQPWRFVVVQGEKRAEMIGIMRECIARVKEQGGDPGSSEWTTNSMEQAPVTVFVLNPESEDDPRPGECNVVDVQSVGGAIQTMLLTATDLGLGTLWICDVFYAYDDLLGWLGRKEQIIAAVSIGYADEAPEARPRRPWQEVTDWVGG